MEKLENKLESHNELRNIRVEIIIKLIIIISINNYQMDRNRLFNRSDWPMGMT